MIVNAFALITALFYMMNIPLFIKLRVSREGTVTIRLGAFKIGRRVIIDTNVRDLVNIYRKRKKQPKNLSLRVSLKSIVRALVIHRVEVEASLSDASSTALASGVIALVLSAVAPGAVSVTPVFSSSEIFFSASCIISVSVGHAVTTALSIASDVIKERIKNGTARPN